jgi:hypothetical protein
MKVAAPHRQPTPEDEASLHCLAAPSPLIGTTPVPMPATHVPAQERGWYLLPDAARILRRSGAYGRAWLPPLLPDYYGLIALGPIMGCPVPITKATYKKRPLVSTAKAARELGITEWIPMQRSVLDMAADLTKKGMVPAWKLPVAWPVLAVAGGVVAWLVYVLGGRLGLF